MEQTRCAFKVVSDPYAPEESWLPACSQVESSTALVHRDDFAFPTTFHAVVCTLGLSMIMALLGGALAGQSTHVSYYAHHLFSLFAYNDLSFEPWGRFYFWFNQVSTAFAFAPAMFCYSIGFLGICFGLGRKATWLALPSMAIYFVAINLLYLSSGTTDVNQPSFYFTVWNLVGLVGSVLAFTLGKRVAVSLSSVTSPFKLYVAMMFGLLPCGILCLSYSPVLYWYHALVGLCLATPMFIGISAPVILKASSVKSALSLALTANTPLVFCALLHVPIGIWYVASWSPRSQYGLMAELCQYAFYCVVPLLVPIVAAAFGGLRASRLSIELRQKASHESLTTGYAAERALEDAVAVGLPATSP
ncbi:MAG: hypothetical protein K2X93_16910 [Candidatus Obscuribacterales bacterium]|nr:hypothetical protein [Candidatus Obscuribacterales bacterium]